MYLSPCLRCFLSFPRPFLDFHTPLSAFLPSTSLNPVQALSSQCYFHQEYLPSLNLLIPHLGFYKAIGVFIWDTNSIINGQVRVPAADVVDFEEVGGGNVSSGG